ncbi:MAG: hypothetical protein JSU01_12755 [Bacteroidetes bacterium]|nr:hypothetical protein [Bacteroidota bacterium]
MSLGANAQSNYKPGYVVTSKGDTVKGYIDYQEWELNPETISFRKTENEQTVQYGVNDIVFFTIDKAESYVKYTGRITMDQTDPNRVIPDNQRDTSFRTGTVFLKVIEKGPRVILYSYQDDIKVRYFISAAPGAAPKELIFRVTTSYTEFTYQKQLSAAAYQYNELNDALIALISRANYTEDNILEIVGKINHISQAEYNKTYASGPAYTLFAGAGLNLTTTIPPASSPFYAAGARSYTSYMPAVYFGANVFANPGTRKLQLTFQLSASGSNLREKYDSKVYPYVPDEAMYNATVFSGSLQVIYNFYNKEYFKAFAGAGIIASAYSFSNTYIGAQDHNNSSVDFNSSEPWLFNTFNDGFLFKAGVQFSKHVELFGEYQSSIGVSQSPYYELSSNTKEIALIYIFR